MTKSELVDDYCAFMLNKYTQKRYDVFIDDETTDALREILKIKTIEQVSKISPRVLEKEFRKFGIHHGDTMGDMHDYYYYIKEIIKATKDYLKDLKTRKIKWELSIRDVLTTIHNQERCTFGLIWELVDREDGRYLLKRTLSDILRFLLNRNLIHKTSEKGRTIYKLTTSGEELLKSNEEIIIQLTTEN